MQNGENRSMNGFTQVENFLIDEVMPRLRRPTAWRLITAILRDSVGWQREWTEWHTRKWCAEKAGCSVEAITDVWNETVPKILLMQDDRFKMLTTTAERQHAGNRRRLTRMKINPQIHKTYLSIFSSSDYHPKKKSTSTRGKSADTQRKDDRKENDPEGSAELRSDISDKQKKLLQLEALLSIDDIQFLKSLLDNYPELDAVKVATDASEWINDEGRANIGSRKHLIKKFFSTAHEKLLKQKHMYGLNQAMIFLDGFYRIYPERKPKKLKTLLRQAKFYIEVVGKGYTNEQMLETAKWMTSMLHWANRFGFEDVITVLPAYCVEKRKRRLQT
ncbi:MAG: hypothetical protein HY044_00340 [Candidatus Woesebacteria bacterium]|nr:MAG: hypothetical protein HY044_00340 [Candidatus Woesebacteria bacterium]